MGLRDENSATLSCSSKPQQDAFGWQQHYDSRTNLAFMMHSYTGEVRWMHPKDAGFVMDGRHPLPASASDDQAWNPFFPHVVMVPSGLIQLYPDSTEQVPMLCRHNRFPVTRPREMMEADDAIHKLSRRVLPPTWEKSNNGSPFVPPFPLAVLTQADQVDIPNPKKIQPPDYQEQECHLSAAAEPRQVGEQPPSHVREYTRSNALTQQSSPEKCVPLDKSSTACQPQPRESRSNNQRPKATRASSQRQRHDTRKKEHNRLGYLLRQTRRMQRSLESQGVHPDSITTTSATFCSLEKTIQSQSVHSNKHQQRSPVP